MDGLSELRTTSWTLTQVGFEGCGTFCRKCHAQRRQMTLAIIIAKMIRSISQPRLTCRCPQTHPFISRDMLRYSCSKPKEKNCHSGYLHTKLSQYDNNSSVPACLRVQCTFSASVPVFPNTSVSGFTKTNCNNPSNVSHTWPACDTAQLSKFQSKNMKANLQQNFLFRFKIQFKTVSTSYTVQVVSIDLQ